MSIRKALHDKVITDFTALDYAGTSTDLFQSVSKYILDIPTNTPVCEIVPFNTNIVVEGIDFDTRSVGFRAVVYHNIEGTSQSDAAKVIDQANLIEDVVLDYLEQIPTPITVGTATYNVYRVNVGAVDYVYTQGESGYILMQIFDFSYSLSIPVKTL